MSKATVNPTVTKLFINGQFVNSVGGQTIQSIDPRTEEKNGVFQAACNEDIDLAVESARNAFDNGPWPRMSGVQRASILFKIASEIERRTEELAQLETLDNGKPVFFSRFADIPLSASHFRYYAGWADKIHGETLTHHNNFGQHLAYTLKEPLGVAGQIIPWNFPLLMASWKLAPALATGCTIVLKPSEKTPMTALVLGEIFQAVGLPEGVVNIVPGYGGAGAHLAQHEGVDKIAFTGSTATAKKIKNAMGLKPFTAELGGKSPLLVFADADIENAVNTAVHGTFFNHGQCCNASTRVYVHSSIFDEFLAKAKAKAEQRRLGDPFGDVDQGPQVDKLQFEKIMDYINHAKSSGANIITGGERAFDKGYFIKPTIIANLNEDDKCFREEIFGPVMAITKFDSEDEVVARANDTNFGLAAGILSQNTDIINRVSRKLKAGTIWVNCYHVFDNSTPFGGYKESGFGREKGTMALDNYLQTKTVTQPLHGDASWYR